MSYRLSRRARRDLLQIWNYIAVDSESSADRFIDMLIQHFHLLERNPYIGRDRDELRAGYRSFPVGQYLIFYRIMGPGVQIMHVMHSKRDIENLFGA
ncbi:MAG TPA: type II toxin-antitoxin system RelE/ParE family toxin [Acidobacteriaceae bacterium]